MEGYRIVTDHILLTGIKDTYSISDGYVVGISIEVTDESTIASMKFGLDEFPKVLIKQGDAARQYGTYEACGVPCYYDGKINYDFGATGGQALLIVTRLTTQRKEIA